MQRSNLSSLALEFAALLTLLLLSSTRADAQAYTINPPACGVLFDEQSGAPLEQGVVYEVAAANDCVAKTDYQTACKHFKAALSAMERLQGASGNYDDLKGYVTAQQQIQGCH